VGIAGTRSRGKRELGPARDSSMFEIWIPFDCLSAALCCHFPWTSRWHLQIWECLESPSTWCSAYATRSFKVWTDRDARSEWRGRKPYDRRDT